MNHVKALRDPLTAGVYQQNHAAVAFYLARGFRIVGESICELTGCEEYQLEWRKPVANGE